MPAHRVTHILLHTVTAPVGFSVHSTQMWKIVSVVLNAHNCHKFGVLIVEAELTHSQVIHISFLHNTVINTHFTGLLKKRWYMGGRGAIAQMLYVTDKS